MTEFSSHLSFQRIRHEELERKEAEEERLAERERSFSFDDIDELIVKEDEPEPTLESILSSAKPHSGNLNSVIFFIF